MGDEGRDGARSTREHEGGPAGPPGGVSDPALPELVNQPQSPLYHAEHAARYERQRLIEAYEREYHCRLVVMCDAIFGESITLFEELIYDADPAEDLHLILDSLGGDGESAVRIARAAQARCRRFTVIVPDQAKSAGTIIALGAHEILMGPTSDLGPVDPQLQLPRASGGWQLVAAKDLIAAVAAAEEAVQDRPDTYPLHASLLADVTEIMLQQARSAIERTGDLVEQAIRANPDLSERQAKALAKRIREPLIERPQYHGAIFGAGEAEEAGLPVSTADPSGLQWRAIWQLWSKYFLLNCRVYEGRRASRIIGQNV